LNRNDTKINQKMNLVDFFWLHKNNIKIIQTKGWC